MFIILTGLAKPCENIHICMCERNNGHESCSVIWAFEIIVIIFCIYCWQTEAGFSNSYFVLELQDLRNTFESVSVFGNSGTLLLFHFFVPKCGT